MKKIISMLIAITLILTIGVTAFADDKIPTVIEAGKPAPYTITVNTSNGIKVFDANGFLTISEPVVGTDFVAFNATASVNDGGKTTCIVVKNNKGEEIFRTGIIEIGAPAVPAPPAPEAVLDDNAVITVVDNNATVDMAGYSGISAKLYNTLKSENYETITFVGDGYTWTIVRGDYTKMNVTAPIYFGVEVGYGLYNDKGERDLAAENAVLKALGNTKADVFYVRIADNTNIGNIASKPALVIEVSDVWTKVNNTMSITALKFDGTNATEIATGLSIKPVTNKMELQLTTAGLYVFTDDAVNVNANKPSTPTTKPNAPTGGDMSVMGIVVTALMGAASCGVKKIFG